MDNRDKQYLVDTTRCDKKRTVIVGPNGFMVTLPCRVDFNSDDPIIQIVRELNGILAWANQPTESC